MLSEQKSIQWAQNELRSELCIFLPHSDPDSQRDMNTTYKISEIQEHRKNVQI